MISSHTTSRELSERLKKLGVPQESYFSWVGNDIWDQTMQSDYETPNTFNRKDWVSAYLASELGNLLPWSMFGKFLVMVKDAAGGWNVYYEDNKLGFPIEKKMIQDQGADTLAEAMGKMLEYLAKEGLIKFN